MSLLTSTAALRTIFDGLEVDIQSGEEFRFDAYLESSPWTNEADGCESEDEVDVAGLRTPESLADASSDPNLIAGDEATVALATRRGRGMKRLSLPGTNQSESPIPVSWSGRVGGMPRPFESGARLSEDQVGLTSGEGKESGLKMCLQLDLRGVSDNEVEGVYHMGERPRLCTLDP